MSDSKEYREATPSEWAAEWIKRVPLTVEALAELITYAEARGARHERDACYRLATEHARTITENTVAQTPLGSILDEQGRIDVASSQRHVAQYVGALIYGRNPKPDRLIEC